MRWTTLTFLLLFLSIKTHALNPIHSFQATPKKSILAATHLAPSTRTTPTAKDVNDRSDPTSDNDGAILAIAGHNGGTVSIHKLRKKKNDVVSTNRINISPHDGSVFTLAAAGGGGGSGGKHGQYLISGSFDRSAILQRIRCDSIDLENGENDSLDIHAEVIGKLPEHTGWVRGVDIIHDKKGDDDDDASPFLLSIGCNLINIWTTVTTTAAAASHGTSTAENRTTRRLARLDAGPSPGDPTNEPFRRHDILTIATSEDDSYIVAGLVDGTIRAFRSKWQFWKDRRTTNGEYFYDNTGSCRTPIMLDDDDDDDVVEDDVPCAAALAHEGRITGIHSIPGVKSSNQFITVGHDGWWRRWRLDDTIKEEPEASLFVMMDSGSVMAEPDEDIVIKNDFRICSSVLVPSHHIESEAEWSLVVGTIGGCIYRVSIGSEVGSSLSCRKCSKLWSEEGDNDSITALTWMPLAASNGDDDDGDGLEKGGSDICIVAGTSHGFVRVFAQ